MIRGMVGTGLTFAIVVGGVSFVLGLIALALGWISPNGLRMAGKLSVVAFIVGIGFSAVLAIIARGRTLDRLSLRAVTAVGVGGGLLYFLFIGFVNGFRSWTPQVGLLNLGLLAVLGGGAAAATLLVARKAAAALTGADESPQLDAGNGEIVPAVSSRDRLNIRRD